MFNYGDIIEYIDGTYDENFNRARKWAYSNHATFNELVDRRKEIDGVLHRFFEIKEIIIPERTLDELKEQKRIEINHSRDAAEQGGFEYMGKVFDSDQVSCQRISTAAQALQLMNLGEGSDIPVITWTCADNSTIDLTASDLAGLVIALMEHSNSCHQKATELKEQVEKATTEEELNAISW